MMIDILRSIKYYKMETKKSNAMPYDIEGQNAEQNGDWIKSIHKERITSTMTKYFHDVNPQWKGSDSEKVVNIIEKLVYKTIDVDKLNRLNMSKNGFTFSFSIVQNMYSDELLDLLMEYHTDKWHFVQEVFMKDGLVDLVYEDRYLNTPIGCLILAQFIRRMKDLFKLRYQSIEINLSRRDFRVMFDDNTLKIDRKFSFPENRDTFFRMCMDKIVGDNYTLKVGNTKHARTFVLRNSSYELLISPDGGISHGWGIGSGSDNCLTVDALKGNLDMNIHCFNRAAHSYDRAGIPYVISLSPLGMNNSMSKE